MKILEEVIIVIPIYKKVLDQNELRSLNQCCKILGNYSIYFVAPFNLNVSTYVNCLCLFDIKANFIYFDNQYFENIEGYNRLLLSLDFYEKFVFSHYILIYQLDAFVFRDDLLKWCRKGYDYIGAPLIGKFQDKYYSQEYRVGNGGFSLRKVTTFIDFFRKRNLLFNSQQIKEKICLNKKPYTRWAVYILMCCGWRNRPKYVASHWKYNEDDFWSGLLDKSQLPLKKPAPKEAFLFSIERFPSECYKIHSELPFGCHAWMKYEYETFWHNYI